MKINPFRPDLDPMKEVGRLRSSLVVSDYYNPEQKFPDVMSTGGFLRVLFPFTTLLVETPIKCQESN